MYPFLSQPPPQQQRRHRPPPLTSSPSQRRSNSISVAHPYANISAWASKVQPGSPAPCSPPHRRPSTSSRRRASHSRAPSGSLVSAQHTPSSATGEYPADLTAVGYTSLFVQFDKTPTTPSPFKTRNGNGLGSIPLPAAVSSLQSIKPAKRKGLQRFRSILRSNKFKSSQPGSPPKMAKKVELSAADSQRKRVKYAGKNGSSKRPPPSLANDLALMQFMEGGTMEDNVKRVMEARAKAVGGREKSLGVEGVYRDEKGGIWYDGDEQMEYAHLLCPEDDDVESEDEKTKLEDDFVLVIGPIVKASSPNTDAYCPLDNVRVRESPILPCISTTYPKPSLLSLPFRPRRRNLCRPSLSKAYAHLSKAPTYLLDMDAFAPRPKSPLPRGSFAVGLSTTTTSSSSSKKFRHRPTPLQLSSTQSAHARANAKVASVALNGKFTVKGTATKMTRSTSGSSQKITGLSPLSLERARREFVEDSFEPTRMRLREGVVRLDMMK